MLKFTAFGVHNKLKLGWRKSSSNREKCRKCSRASGEKLGLVMIRIGDDLQGDISTVEEI